MHKIIVPALAALSLAALPTPGAAETTSVSVPIADLDLSTNAGMATLESRLRAAVARVCGTVEVRRVRDGADRQRCLAQAEASVRVEIARRIGSAPVLALSR